ncbi:uncharacterized protein LOC112589871 [Harpegnathos saltator]|uniref:uncharacterized protein LOC112589871 n=1 Tax=Harpegnathos saltator TaxID=610380 RepID=UPI000DBED297|nr:uncharacterized protein LOC112589871 [Harpegnathos saltator]
MSGKKLEVYVNDELWTFNISNAEFEAATTGNEELIKFLVAKESEKKSIAVIDEEQADKSRQPISEANEAKKDSFIWPDKAILLLLEIYRNKKSDFVSGLIRHNKIWMDIASEMNKAKYNVTAIQCQNKMSGLKRTYKNISDSNNKSDNHASSWAFYSVMDSILGKKTWIEPASIASSDGPSSPGCSSSSSDKSLEADEPKPKKRRVESILESFIAEMKEDKQKKKEEKQRRRDERREEKENKWKQNSETRKSRMEFHQSLLKLLAKIAEQK